MSGFKDVVGHRDIISYIQSSVAMNKISHAYILNGERGAGKKMLATLFAETLLCEKGGISPCNECHSCLQVNGGNHPDLIWVNSAKPNSIGIDDIREQVTNDVQIKPYQGPYKIYVIPQADKMTPQAQNALLKTIEEPPAYAVIFLLTENAELLLPTITSRCVMIRLRNIRDTLIEKYLMEKMNVPDYKAKLCAAFAQGNVGRAIMLANSEHYNEIRESAVYLLKHVKEMEIADLVKAVNESAAFKVEITDYLDVLTVWYRDILLYKATTEVERVVFQDEIQTIKARARECSYEGIEKILNGIEKAKERLRANVNFELAMELLFLTMKEN